MLRLPAGAGAETAGWDRRAVLGLPDGAEKAGWCRDSDCRLWSRRPEEGIVLVYESWGLRKICKILMIYLMLMLILILILMI